MVNVEKNGAVTTVIIDRPEARNAVDKPTADALKKAFLEFDDDTEARVAVLCGAGGTFCAGADLKSIGTDRSPAIDPEGDGPLGPTRLQLSKPVIAAVSGAAVAGGMELAIWADLRVVEQDAYIGVFCRRWGVPLIDGGTVRLARLIGHSRALDMMLTGRPVYADEALQFGLANRVVPTGKSREEAEKLAAEIAAFPQTCMRNDRRSSYEQWGMPLEDVLRNEARIGMDSLQSPEMADGVGKFTSGKGRHGKFD